MKPKIAALGFAGLLAVWVAALAFGVPARFLTKLAQDQVESHSTYRFRVDGPTTLSFRPSPTVATCGGTVARTARAVNASGIRRGSRFAWTELLSDRA